MDVLPAPVAAAANASNPNDSITDTASKRQTADVARRTKAWAPVEKALKGRDVSAVTKAFAAYEATNTVADGLRGKVAEFYIAHHATKEAKAQLDLVIHADRSKSPRSYDPKICLMWLLCNPDVSASEKEAVVQAWASGYRAELMGKDMLMELGPHALLQFKVGQAMTSSPATRVEGIGRLEEALRLSPDSVGVATTLIAALRNAGNTGRAREVALDAAARAKNEDDKQALLTEGQVQSAPREKATP